MITSSDKKMLENIKTSEKFSFFVITSRILKFACVQNFFHFTDNTPCENWGPTRMESNKKSGLWDRRSFTKVLEANLTKFQNQTIWSE